jgi:hypothetical protein
VRDKCVPKAARAPKKKVTEVVDADGRGIVVESRTRGKKRRIVFDPSPESPDQMPPPPKPKQPQKRVGNFANSEEVYALLPAKPMEQPAFSHNFDELVTKLDAATGCAKDACVARISLKAGDVLRDPGTFGCEGMGEDFEIVGDVCFSVKDSRTQRLVRHDQPNVKLEVVDGLVDTIGWRLLVDLEPGAPLVAALPIRRPAPPKPSEPYKPPEAVGMVIDHGAESSEEEPEPIPKPEKEKFLAPTIEQQRKEPKLPPPPLKIVDPRPKRTYADVDRVRWIAGLYPDEPPPEDFDLVVRVPSLFLPYGGLSTPAIQRSQRPFFRPHQFLSERYFEVPEEIRRPVMMLDWHTEAWVSKRAERRAAALAHRRATGRNDEADRD